MLKTSIEDIYKMALEYEALKSQKQQCNEPAIVYSGDDVPINLKVCLTLKEAAKYTGIGINKLREISNDNPAMTLFVGSKRLLKREMLDVYLKKMYSI